MNAMAGQRWMTTGQAAREIGAESWQVARLFQRGLVEEPRRLGQFRLIAESDLPALKRAAEAAGYLHGTC
jgi:hypothetical protein